MDDPIDNHSTLGLRPPFTAEYTPPSIGLHSFTIFRHPGYKNGTNLLFRLPSLDGNHSTRGIHHGTALTACSIIACNMPGFLSPIRLESPPLLIPVVPDLDELLTAPEYYFYPRAWVGSPVVGSFDLQYPVCPDFENWQFPHQALPLEWTTTQPELQHLSSEVPAPSQYSFAVTKRDRICRVSGFSDCLQTAHLVQKDQYKWFGINEMSIYNLSLRLPQEFITSDIQNCIRIRADLHLVFDAASFVFVPKAGSWRVHFLAVTRDYGGLFHNRETEGLMVSREFIYARFAWSVLPLAGEFAGRVGVKVRVRDELAGDWVDKVVLNEVIPFTPDVKRNKRRTGEGAGAGGEQTVIGDPSSEAVPKRTRRFSTENISEVEPLEIHSEPTPGSSAIPLEKASNPGLAEIVGNCTASRGGTNSLAKRIFNNLVGSEPKRAWNTIMWHPESDRMNAIREKWLMEREPGHAGEVKRQIEMLEAGMVWGDEDEEY